MLSKGAIFRVLFVVINFLMTGRKSPIRTSAIFKYILRCLKEKRHSHMLKWIGNLEFEITLKDRTNPSWTPHDNSLLEEMDMLFDKEPKKSTSPRSRFVARMSSLCRRRLKETTNVNARESSQKTIKRKTYKILSENCGAELAFLGIEASVPVANANIDSVENGPHSRQTQMRALNLSNATSHYSTLSKCQDFYPGRLINEILTQEMDKHESTIIPYLIKPCVSKVPSDDSHARSQIKEMHANGNIYDPNANMPLINKKMKVITVQRNGNNYDSNANILFPRREMEVVMEQGNENNYVSKASLLFPPGKEMEVVTEQGNGNNYVSKASLLFPPRKEMEVVTELGNGNNYVSKASLLFPPRKEMEVVTKQGNGNNYTSKASILFPLRKEMDAVMGPGNENNYVSKGHRLLLPRKEMEVVTEQGNGNNYVSKAGMLSLPRKEMEVVTEQGNGNNYVSKAGMLSLPRKEMEVVTQQGNGNNYVSKAIPKENFEIQYFDQNGKRIPLEYMVQHRPILINPTIVINTGSTIAPKTMPVTPPNESLKDPESPNKTLNSSSSTDAEDFILIDLTLPESEGAELQIVEVSGEGDVVTTLALSPVPGGSQKEEMDAGECGELMIDEGSVEDYIMISPPTSPVIESWEQEIDAVEGDDLLSDEGSVEDDVVTSPTMSPVPSGSSEEEMEEDAADKDNFFKVEGDESNIPDYGEKFMDFSDPDSFKDFGMLNKLLPNPDLFF